MTFSFFGRNKTKKQGVHAKRVYLDHAAASPVHPEVLRAMEPYWSDVFGNARSIHAEGRAAARALSGARAKVAEVLKARAQDIVFTSGGTESNNLAIVGVVSALRAKGVPDSDIEIISTEIEHPSILETLRALEKSGITIRYMNVGEDGLIDQKAFESMLSPKTKLITFAYVNSEIGVVQEVKKITRAVRAYKMEHDSQYPYVHLDACQAPLWLPVQLDSLAVDLVTLDGGKCGGPKGSGVLVSRGNVPYSAVVFGGVQEGGHRPGTENVPFAVGFATALSFAQASWKERAEKVSDVRNYFFAELEKTFPDVVVHGSRELRVANNVNVAIPGVDGEYAVVWLDTRGVSASTKSACNGSAGGSHVVRALERVRNAKGISHALSTIRFTLGEETTKADIDRVIVILKEHMAQVTTLPAV